MPQAAAGSPRASAVAIVTVANSASVSTCTALHHRQIASI